MPRVLARLAAGIAVALLAACAALPSPPPRLSGVPSDFEMSGRLAVREGQRSDIARLRWTRTGDRDEWVISSPLGNEIARIESTPRGATLSRADGETEEAPSFEALTAKLLGVALDPAWLADVLHGRDPANLPAGWQFHVDEKEKAGAIDLAKRVTVSRGDTVVRLVVDRYEPRGE